MYMSVYWLYTHLELVWELFGTFYIILIVSID